MSLRARIAVVLGTALVVHLGLLFGGPYAVMRAVVGRPLEGVGRNAMGHRELPHPGMHDWAPSPDLLYSKCVYDVRAAPLRVTTPVPDGYWSMSVYAANTDLVAVVNDRELPAHALDVVLALPEQPVPAGASVIRVPGPHGVALFRALVPEPAQEGALDALRRQGRCTPLGPA